MNLTIATFNINGLRIMGCRGSKREILRFGDTPNRSLAFQFKSMSGTYAFGNEKKNRLPFPSSLSTQTLPPWL
jgi:hypothetical protein